MFDIDTPDLILLLFFGTIFAVALVLGSRYVRRPRQDAEGGSEVTSNEIVEGVAFSGIGNSGPVSAVGGFVVGHAIDGARERHPDKGQ